MVGYLIMDLLRLIRYDFSIATHEVSMLTRHLPLLLPLATTIIGCQMRSGNSAELKLIGGETVTAEQFPASVALTSNGVEFCSSVKVAPRVFLTSAHCVLEQTPDAIDNGTQKIYEALAPGRPIAMRNADGLQLTVPIAKVVPHPLYRYALSSAFSGPDVALITVADDSPGIGIASLSKQNLLAGAEILVGGFGCERGRSIDGSDTTPGVHPLKYAKATLLDDEAVRASSGSTNVEGIEPKSFKAMRDTFFSTRGIQMDPSSSSICPGDSGGPAYVGNGGAYEVVGVNSWTNYKLDGTDPDGLGTHSMITRLDAGGRYDLKSWIESQITGTPLRLKWTAEKFISFPQGENIVELKLLPFKANHIGIDLLGTYRRCASAVSGVSIGETDLPDLGAGKFQITTEAEITALKVKIQSPYTFERCLVSVFIAD